MPALVRFDVDFLEVALADEVAEPAASVHVVGELLVHAALVVAVDAGDPADVLPVVLALAVAVVGGREVNHDVSASALGVLLDDDACAVADADGHHLKYDVLVVVAVELYLVVTYKMILHCPFGSVFAELPPLVLWVVCCLGFERWGGSPLPVGCYSLWLTVQL